MSDYLLARTKLSELLSKLKRLAKLEDIEFEDVEGAFEEIKEFNQMYDQLKYGYELKQVTDIFAYFIKAIHHFMLLHGDIAGKTMSEIHQFAYQTIVNLVRSLHRPSGKVAVTSTLPHDVFQGIGRRIEEEEITLEESTEFPEYDPEILKEKKTVKEFREELMRILEENDNYRISMENLHSERKERMHVILTLLSSPPKGKEVIVKDGYIIVQLKEEAGEKATDIISFRVK